MKTTLTKAAAFTLLAAGAWSLPGAPAAQASTIGVIATPATPPTTEIGARMRWGGTGFEGSVYDNSPLTQNPTLNPQGTPFWQVGQAYGFRVAFDSASGAISLAVDFNRDQSFSAGETATQTAFGPPGQTSYAGFGFEMLSISLNQGGSTGRSVIRDLTINGTAFGTFSNNDPTLVDVFYASTPAAPIANWTITGTVSFTVAGTSQERPAWDFRFRGVGTPTNGGGDPTLVPAPAGLAVLGLGLLGLAALRRRG